MTWTTTSDVEECLAVAGEFLRARPVENTVFLTVLDRLRAGAPATASASAPLFGWWQSVGVVAGVFIHTPPYPVLITPAPDQAVEPLAGVLAELGRPVGGVNADPRHAAAFAASWRMLTGAIAEVHRRDRLYRLGELSAPHPAPAGRAVVAGPEHRPLLIAWYEAFQHEIGEVARDVAGQVDEGLRDGGLTLWEVDGDPVSLAGATREVVGMVRVAPVYTPPEHRRRGYAGAVTAAVSAAALRAGVRDVVLFADVANATSTHLYERLGFRPVEERLMLMFRDSLPRHG